MSPASIFSDILCEKDTLGIKVMQPNMELCSKFVEPSKLNRGDGNNPSHGNTIALTERTFSNNTLLAANNGCENPNNNDGTTSSSAETFLLSTHKYDNVSEVSHLSTSSCETLLTSLANEDTKPDQSIDEVDEIIRNEDMSCAINMAPLLLQEYRKLDEASNSSAKSKPSDDLVLVASANSSAISSPSSSGSSTASSSINQTRSTASASDTTSILCSPFRRRKKVSDIEDEPEPSQGSSKTYGRGRRAINGMTLPIVTKVENASSTAKTAITRDELLSLYILKLDEEANYFKVSPTSPEEELCDCNKCQTYYREYYSRYLEEYEMRQNGVTSGGGEILGENKDVHICDKEAQDPSKDIEAALLMDDILNNGINFCAIM